MRRVPFTVLLRVFVRSLYLQAAWNPRGMQNLGFAYAIEPALGSLHPDRAQHAGALRRHLEFFNCHPYLAAAILGGCVHLEERVAAGTCDAAAVSAFKRTLGPPLAAVGDGFFWLALRPATALAAIATIPSFGLWAPLVFLVLYNAAHVGLRVWLFFAGYGAGEQVVAVIARAHLALGTPLLKACGAALAGVIGARLALLAAAEGHVGHGVLVGCVVVLAALLLPRIGQSVALYLALGIGLALGSSIL